MSGKRNSITGPKIHNGDKTWRDTFLHYRSGVKNRCMMSGGHYCYWSKPGGILLSLSVVSVPDPEPKSTIKIKTKSIGKKPAPNPYKKLIQKTHRETS